MANYVPVRTGFRFTGWYSTNQLLWEVLEVTLTTNRIVYAGWEENKLEILTQPTDQTGKIGDTITLKVEAAGDELQYQWQYKNGNTAIWTDSGMAGSKTAEMNVVLTQSRVGQQYRCKITDSSGETIYTYAVKLLEKEAEGIVIKTQPADQSGKIGDTLTLKVEAAGNDLQYQWQYKNGNTAVWTDSGMAGAKTAEMNVQLTPTRAGQEYRCRITDTNGNVVYTNVVRLDKEEIPRP